MQLKGKKILLFITPFYDYHKLIKKELEMQGAEVCMIENRWPIESFKYSTNLLLTIKNRIKNPFYLTKHTKEVLKLVEGQNFDFMLALGGFSPNRQFVKYIKNQNPNLSTRIFFWDSFKYWKIQHLRKWFDKCYSFDQLDCRKYKELIYQPDFYIGSQSVNEYEEMYDLSHIGSSHMFAYERIEILDKLKKQANNLDLKSYIMVYDPINVNARSFKLMALTNLNWAKYRKILKKYQNHDIVTNQKMEYQKVLEIEAQSRCIIDIPHLKQSGATVRALETLAAGKKLITTNKYIVNERFYNPNNICIINPGKPILDSDFLKTPYVQTDLSYLKLGNWLNSILK